MRCAVREKSPVFNMVRENRAASQFPELDRNAEVTLRSDVCERLVRRHLREVDLGARLANSALSQDGSRMDRGSCFLEQ